MTWQGSTTMRDRIFAALPYLLPLMYGLQFGDHLLTQFPVLQILFVPLIPVMAIYALIPFGLGGLVIFFALFLLVVRNYNISHFIRFNTMQAILLDIVLFLCGLIVPFLANALAVGLVGETLYNTIFLGNLIAIGYASVQALRGLYSEIPIISEAASMQVR